MAVTVKNIIPAKYAEASQTTQYISQNCKTIIDKFTASNNSSDNVRVSVHLINSGSAGGNNLIVSANVPANEVYAFPELVGHSLEDGSLISTLANAADSIVIRATGREVT